MDSWVLGWVSSFGLVGHDTLALSLLLGKLSQVFLMLQLSLIGFGLPLSQFIEFLQLIVVRALLVEILLIIWAGLAYKLIECAHFLVERSLRIQVILANLA